jgi:putative sterol carrier protein
MFAALKKMGYNTMFDYITWKIVEPAKDLYYLGNEAATVELKSGPGSLRDGRASSPDLVLTVADADLASLTSGAASLRSLYQHGKVRVDGDAKIVRKLAFLEKIG